MAVIDPRYVTTVSLEEYFVNNGTGTPNSDGAIWFWQDNNRNVPKPVFQLVNLSAPNTPPNYAYVQLPNPITLSSVGTPVDNNGNNIAIYYFPYDAAGNIQLYFVQVYDSFGVLQEQREGWPNIGPTENPDQEMANISNELSNPQFVDIFFTLTNPLVINFTGIATTTVGIAPNWNLQVTHTANTTVTLTRNAIAGNLNYPNNPPYTLTILPGANITAVSLVQVLSNNPNIYAPAPAGLNGWIASSILLAPNSSVTMQYFSNAGMLNPFTILAANNGTANYVQYNNTIQLPAGNNPQNADTGFVSIILALPTGAATTLSNVQIVGLDSDVPNVGYDQTTANRQRDQLFNFYSPLLQAKPIPSYLIGWDFPLNPTQVSGNGAMGPFATGGAAGSFQAWDQTVVFQSATNGVTLSRSASGNGALRITANAGNPQFAIIQYLPQAEAREILQNTLSVMLSATTNGAYALGGTVSLWYSTDANLPSTAANNSIVATLTAGGKPATFNGNWTEVPRVNLWDATFSVTQSATTNWIDYGFSPWSLNGGAAVNTAVWFAIVVGFSAFTNTRSIDIGSSSLVPGSIPTRPAPRPASEVILNCQRYYEKSFPPATVPAQVAGIAGATRTYAFQNGAPFGVYYQSIVFQALKNSIPTITTYNPLAATNTSRNLSAPANGVGVTVADSSQHQFSLTDSGTTLAGDEWAIHWTADSRLGL